MAKKVLKWSSMKDAFRLGVITVEHTDHPDKLAQEFYMDSLYDMWPDFDEAQKGFAINGVKQRLADANARDKDMKLTPEERVIAFKEMWDRACGERLYFVEATERGKQLPMAPVVNMLRRAGISDEQIAKDTKKPLAMIQEVPTEVVEEEVEEETKE